MAILESQKATPEQIELFKQLGIREFETKFDPAFDSGEITVSMIRERMDYVILNFLLRLFLSKLKFVK